MPLSMEQIEANRLRLTASKLPKVLGLDPYCTPWQLQAETLGLIEPEESSRAAVLGGLLEEPIRIMAMQEWPDLIANSETFWRDELGASPDYLRPDSTADGKSSGFNGPVARAWIDCGPDSAPLGIQVQCQAQAWVCGKPECGVAAIIGGQPFRTLLWPADTDLVEGALEVADPWWKRHIVNRDPVPVGDVAPPLAIVKRLRRIEGKSIRLGEDAAQLYATWREAKALANKLEKEIKDQEATLRAMMGDACRAELEGGPAVYLQTISRKGYTVDPTSYTTLKEEK